MSKITLLKTPKELQAYCIKARENANAKSTKSTDKKGDKKSTLGLVPTMGALHAGHSSLIATSIKQNSHTIVSIFVNPAQFSPSEDLATYPRTIEADIARCEELGASAVFLPQASDMYQSDDEASINPPKSLACVLEGFARPSHFGGVLQVIMKLFWLSCADNAYFGRKDAQQLLVIQKMVKDFFIPISIVPCPIVRDKDGLALSSRNAYLSKDERQIARAIPKAIESMKKHYDEISAKSKNHKIDSKEAISAKEVLSVGQKVLQNSGVKLDYLEACDYELKRTDTLTPDKSIILLAGFVGKTRLLDNLWL